MIITFWVKHDKSMFVIQLPDQRIKQNNKSFMTDAYHVSTLIFHDV